MEHLAKSEVGEKVKRFRRPQPSPPRLSHCFGEFHAVNRCGEFLALQFIVRRYERKDDLALCWQRRGKAQKRFDCLATEILRDPQHRAKCACLALEAVFIKPNSKLLGLQVCGHKGQVWWRREAASAKLGSGPSKRTRVINVEYSHVAGKGR